MEKVQNLKSSNTAPSSKTFRDETLLRVVTVLVVAYGITRIQTEAALFQNPLQCGTLPSVPT
jgi:hypothetical protein